MSARTQAFILLLLGGALARLALGAALLRYVRPSTRPWVLLAGLVVVAVAVGNLVAVIRVPPPDAVEHDADGHSAVTRVAWFVLAPVIVLLVVSPPALGVFSASRQPAQVPARVDFPPLPRSNPVMLTMLDYATRAIWDGGRTVSGKNIALTGFVLADNARGFILTRLVITCCAADAQPVNVQIVDPGSRPVVDSWIRATGSYARASTTSKTLPLLRAQQLALIKQPTNPYDD